MTSVDVVFFDTNILLDVLCQRKPFFADSASAWTLAETRQIQGVVSAISFTNTFYVIRKLAGRPAAERSLRLMRDCFQIAACDARVIEEAMGSGLADFEDAVQHASAVRLKAEYLLSRNPDHFPASPVKVLSPTEYLALRAR